MTAAQTIMTPDQTTEPSNSAPPPAYWNRGWAVGAS